MSHNNHILRKAVVPILSYDFVTQLVTQTNTRKESSSQFLISPAGKPSKILFFWVNEHRLQHDIRPLHYKHIYNECCLTRHSRFIHIHMESNNTGWNIHQSTLWHQGCPFVHLAHRNLYLTCSFFLMFLICKTNCKDVTNTFDYVP